jgi:hypothetical protein
LASGERAAACIAAEVDDGCGVLAGPGQEQVVGAIAVEVAREHRGIAGERTCGQGLLVPLMYAGRPFLGFYA